MFENLLEQAVPGALIEVWELPQAAEPEPPPAPHHGCAVVRRRRPLQFRCALPADWMDGQALFFERDAEGIIALLSNHALLGGSVWYRHRCETPRNDVMPFGGGPNGMLHLATLGKSTLLMVCCRDRAVRFDHLKMFRRTASAQLGPLDFAQLDDGDFRELLRLLARCRRADWAVFANQVEILPEAALARHALHFRDYASQSVSEVPNRGYGSETMASIEEKTLIELESQEAVQTAKVWKEPNSVPSELKKILSAQTAYVQYLAILENAGVNENARIPLHGEGKLESFQKRLSFVIQSGLFVDEGHLPATNENIIEMQRRIAYSVHYLKYTATSSRWVTSADRIIDYGGRSDAWLEKLRSKNTNADRPKWIPKVDAALIAHCFGLPAELWEIEDDQIFEDWVKEAKRGADLLSLGGLATEDNSFRVEDLSTEPVQHRIATAGSRAPIAIVWRPRPEIPAGRPLRFVVKIPEDFPTAQVMLFEDDGNCIAHISTSVATDDSLLFSGGLAEIPRRQRLPVGNGKEIKPDGYGAFCWPPMERTAFVALVVVPDASLRLEESSFFRNADPNRVQILQCEQVADLRRRLFAIPPKSKQWLMLKKEVTIVDRGAVSSS
jgi:hypothetical protein